MASTDSMYFSTIVSSNGLQPRIFFRDIPRDPTYSGLIHPRSCSVVHGDRHAFCRCVATNLSTHVDFSPPGNENSDLIFTCPSKDQQSFQSRSLKWNGPLTSAGACRKEFMNDLLISSIPDDPYKPKRKCCHPFGAIGGPTPGKHNMKEIRTPANSPAASQRSGKYSEEYPWIPPAYEDGAMNVTRSGLPRSMRKGVTEFEARNLGDSLTRRQKGDVRHNSFLVAEAEEKGTTEIKYQIGTRCNRASGMIARKDSPIGTEYSCQGEYIAPKDRDSAVEDDKIVTYELKIDARIICDKKFAREEYFNGGSRDCGQEKHYDADDEEATAQDELDGWMVVGRRNRSSKGTHQSQ